MTLYDGAPYFNLILTGPKGVGKTTIGRMIGSRLGVDVLDLETEILAREGQSADEIRALFGEARLKALEAAAVSELALRRQSILIVPGATMLEETNRSRLAESGVMLCLVCPLNEQLRRLHAARGAWFHNPYNRATMLSRLKREQAVTALGLTTIDTSRLSAEAAADTAIELWQEHTTV
ncbi:MAG: AAA family ATPase [Chloroflexi bacterium]|nr:AAA family ATPase [Chloroflexota bacterium]